MKIFDYLKHYDEIVNYICKNDFISEKIIDFYREFVLDNKINKQKKITIDNIIYVYIKDSKFQTFLNKEILDNNNELKDINFFNDLEKRIKKLFKKYNTQKQTVTTKWI